MRNRSAVDVAMLGRDRRARIAAAVALVSAVVAVHGLLLRDGPRASSGSSPAARPATAVSVRQLPLVTATEPAREPIRAAQPSIEGRPGAIDTPRRKPSERNPRSPAQPVKAAGAAAPPAGLVEPTPLAHADPAVAIGLPQDGANSVAPPTYPTRVPAAVQLRYELRRGQTAGDAALVWHHDNGRYELTLQATLPNGTRLEQRSQGGFDAAGLAPERLADRRRGRGIQAANFQREQGRVTFSGPRWELPIFPGVQDRLSWIAQLSAIAAGSDLAEGTEITLQVVGARGAASRWRFQVRGAQASTGPLGAATVWHLVREPEHLYDLRIELWLDPARGFWPVHWRQTQVPGGEAVDWWLAEEPMPAPGT